MIREVAAEEGVDPTEVAEPLHSAIDTDALDKLFDHGTGRVTFEYLGYEVTVDATGHVDLDLIDAE